MNKHILHIKKCLLLPKNNIHLRTFKMGQNTLKTINRNLLKNYLCKLYSSNYAIKKRIV